MTTGSHRFAVLADIHGNRWALEAVLEDLADRGIRRAFNLGDCFYGPLDPAGTAALLRPQEWPTVRGNQDRILIDPPADLAATATWRFVAAELSETDRRWAAERPLTLDVALERRTVSGSPESGRALLFHASPHRDDEAFVERPTERGILLRSPDQLGEDLLDKDLLDKDLHAVAPGDDIRLVLCGHTHVPRTTAFGSENHEGGIVVNPGSVGLPAYTDDAPVPHAMEAGSPHARYCVIEASTEGLRVEHVALPYDWESAAQAASLNGREDWSRWIRTGRA